MHTYQHFIAGGIKEYKKLNRPKPGPFISIFFRNWAILLQQYGGWAPCN